MLSNTLNRQHNRDCSLRVHLSLSYHLLYVPWIRKSWGQTLAALSTKNGNLYNKRIYTKTWTIFTFQVCFLFSNRKAGCRIIRFQPAGYLTDLLIWYPLPYGQEVWSNFDSTICPRSSDPFYIVTFNIKWVTTSWTDGLHTMYKWTRLLWHTEVNY